MGRQATALPHHGDELVLRSALARGYERRVRIAPRLRAGIGAALLGTAALPTTDQASRIGSSRARSALSLRDPLVPRLPRQLARQEPFCRWVAAITQVSPRSSWYSPAGSTRGTSLLLAPILATVFGMRISGTLFTAPSRSSRTSRRSWRVLRRGQSGEVDTVSSACSRLSVIAMTALISRTIQETLFTLRQRTRSSRRRTRAVGRAH